MRVVSADWVVPVEGEPIADGAVAVGGGGGRTRGARPTALLARSAFAAGMTNSLYST